MTREDFVAEVESILRCQWETVGELKQSLSQDDAEDVIAQIQDAASGAWATTTGVEQGRGAGAMRGEANA